MNKICLNIISLRMNHLKVSWMLNLNFRTLSLYRTFLVSFPVERLLQKITLSDLNKTFMLPSPVGYSVRFWVNCIRFGKLYSLTLKK